MVRHAPLTAILSPFFNPRYGARMRSTLPPLEETDSIRPTALTIPVNIAADPRPIMYQSPAGGAPRPPSAVRRQGETPERLETRAPRPPRARRAPAPRTADRSPPRQGVCPKGPPRLPKQTTE